MRMDPTRIPGYGSDADPARRPGHVFNAPPHPAPHARVPPPRQQSEVRQLMHGRPGKSYPPVWGTAQPPSGVAGAVRAFAYRYPDHVVRHWTTLLLADRVDVWEHRVRRVLPLAAGLGAAWLLLRRRAPARAPGRREPAWREVPVRRQETGERRLD